MVFALALALVLQADVSSTPLVTGKPISPIGIHQGVGSYPVSMAMSHDGRYAVVSNCGFRQFLTVINTRTGEVVDRVPFNKEGQGLYYGLCFGPDGTLFVSNGGLDTVTRFALESGKLRNLGNDLAVKKPDKTKSARQLAGLALNSDGTRLLAVENETNAETSFKGSLAVVDTVSGQTIRRVSVGGYPMAVAAITKGASKDKKAFVSSERDGTVSVVDWQTGKVKKTLKIGAKAFELLLSQDQTELYAASWGSDTLSIIDTETDKVTATILLRPAESRGLSGTTPLGLALSPNGKTLYAAMADMNAVAVVDLEDKEVEGYIPTGWYPTSVLATRSNDGLLVASAKGIVARNPNDKETDFGPTSTTGDSKYTQNRLEGTVTKVHLPTKTELARLTAKVMQNNLVERLKAKPEQVLDVPGIKHIIYIIKENRTYDQVLGDMTQGNGDPSLCLFPREVTPNQHALAERFVLMDNFYVCAECSMDGWAWSTAGILTPYISRNSTYNYSGRGKSYDSEGSNSGVAIDLKKIPDVARPPSGYVWEHVQKHGKTIRNFGMFVQSADKEDKRFTKTANAKQVEPNKRFLQNNTCPDFAGYDLSYADSDAWAIHGTPASKQVQKFGAYDDKSRINAWKREFDGMVSKGQMPAFMTVRLGTNHTAGTRAGYPAPRSMVADNDYAVGLLVEAVTNSPFWKSTAIFILEDDAQAGHDHVDCHRSPAFVISPFVRKGTIDSSFYNTDSVLRTMTLLLGLPPMNQYDAVASVFGFFSRDLVNTEPYKAILPSKAIIGEMNGKTAYRSLDSIKLFPRFLADSGNEQEQNDILWRSVKKSKAPKGSVKGRVVEDDD